MSLISITRVVQEHHQHEHHVTERRAPTDESVKLLREMEAEARNAVVASVRVSNTHIDIVAHKHYDTLNDLDRYRMVYSLNGVRRVVNTEIRAGEPAEARLIHELSDDIAVGLLSGVTFKTVG